MAFIVMYKGHHEIAGATSLSQQTLQLTRAHGVQHTVTEEKVRETCKIWWLNKPFITLYCPLAARRELRATSLWRLIII